MFELLGGVTGGGTPSPGTGWFAGLGRAVPTAPTAAKLFTLPPAACVICGISL